MMWLWLAVAHAADVEGFAASASDLSKTTEANTKIDLALDNEVDRLVKRAKSMATQAVTLSSAYEESISNAEALLQRLQTR